MAKAEIEGRVNHTNWCTLRPEAKCTAMFDGDDLIIKFSNFKQDMLTDGKYIPKYKGGIIVCYKHNFELLKRILDLRIEELYCFLYPQHVTDVSHLIMENK